MGSDLKTRQFYPPQLPDSEQHLYKEASDTRLHLYIYKPEGWTSQDNRPAIVFYFGGGWVGGSPSHFLSQAQHYSELGLVTILADYRVASRNKIKIKHCLEDARDVMRYVRINANHLGINPSRVASSGGSAGGHLAACLGVITDHSEEVSSIPNAMILFNPVCVLVPVEGVELSSWNLEKIEQKTGLPPEELSPVHHVKSGNPPCIIFHGTKDKTVTFATAQKFCQLMNQAGNDCKLYAFEGRDHGFFNFNHREDQNDDYYQTLKLTDEFLKKLGWIDLN